MQPVGPFKIAKIAFGAPAPTQRFWSLHRAGSGFGGFELVREAYQVAMREKYRFFTYGDAMLIER